MGALRAGGASCDPGVLGEDRQPSLFSLSQPAHSMSPTTAASQGCLGQALAVQEPEPSSCMRGAWQKFPVPGLHVALPPPMRPPLLPVPRPAHATQLGPSPSPVLTHSPHPQPLI